MAGGSSGAMPGKAAAAFRTIGELSRETGLPQHILRYWETRFPQLRPVTRAGNRRYYRPEDVALVRQIDAWLNHEGYTVRGVQQLLAGGKGTAPRPAAEPKPAAPAPTGPLLPELRRLRDILSQALASA